LRKRINRKLQHNHVLTQRELYWLSSYFVKEVAPAFQKAVFAMSSFTKTMGDIIKTNMKFNKSLRDFGNLHPRPYTKGKRR
jgi:thymidine phosphorylase